MRNQSKSHLLFHIARWHDLLESIQQHEKLGIICSWVFCFCSSFSSTEMIRKKCTCILLIFHDVLSSVASKDWMLFKLLRGLLINTMCWHCCVRHFRQKHKFNTSICTLSIHFRIDTRVLTYKQITKIKLRVVR